MMESAGQSSRLLAAAELAGARAGAYEVLAALYSRPPTEELVAGLLKLAPSPALDALSDGPAAECLRRYALACGGEPDMAALRQEFDDLFVVPLGRYVTPYEAVYRDQRLVGERVVGGLLMGPSTVAVLSDYRAGGVEVAPDCGELPDHIGIELNFMAILCAGKSCLGGGGRAGCGGVDRAAAGISRAPPGSLGSFALPPNRGERRQRFLPRRRLAHGRVRARRRSHAFRWRRVSGE